jgi:rubredoxin
MTGKYECQVCGYVYTPGYGDGSGGVPPGVLFRDLPEGWTCPWCLAATEWFNPLTCFEDEEE